jgi:Predicted pPIWI-associating nuclease
MENPGQDAWSDFGTKLSLFKSSLGKCKAVNVNTSALKDGAKEVVQIYFRQSRPHLVQISFQESELIDLDTAFQNLLKLSNGNNLLRRYKTELSNILTAKVEIDAQREKKIGQAVVNTRTNLPINGQELKILETLKQIVPVAALSYEQGCRDLIDHTRLSYRGTANEFREALRELLDHFAPDESVTKQSGFKFEDAQKKPTMKQKVKFILRARGLSPTAADVPENAVSIVEETIGKLTRSTYNRSSLSTHITTSRGEVQQMKMYLDSVLAELLEIHRTK